MDSMIRELLKEIADFGDPLGQRGRAMSAVRLWNRQARALLTAEPETCEDAREFTRAILLKYRTMTEYDVLEASGEIAAYASQVADKRAEELRYRCAEIAIEYFDSNIDSFEGPFSRSGLRLAILSAKEVNA